MESCGRLVRWAITQSLELQKRLETIRELEHLKEYHPGAYKKTYMGAVGYHKDIDEFIRITKDEIELDKRNLERLLVSIAQNCDGD